MFRGKSSCCSKRLEEQHTHPRESSFHTHQEKSSSSKNRWPSPTPWKGAPRGSWARNGLPSNFVPCTSSSQKLSSLRPRSHWSLQGLLGFYPEHETAPGLETQTASQPGECFPLLPSSQQLALFGSASEAREPGTPARGIPELCWKQRVL